MTIEDITYYIEKDIEEGFYGADCDLREMAHIEVLELLKELEAHREAWGKLEKEIDRLNPDDNSYSVKNNACLIVSKYRPKEGDAE